MNTEYQYNAFISYRHTHPDIVMAEKLHKLLETYKTPGHLVKKGVVKKINRIFKDRDELPTSGNLGDNLINALKDSEFLIVICSPRTPQSQWVVSEIETFKKIHGPDRILTLLIEGEPEDSFPEPLLTNVLTEVDQNGSIFENIVPNEPLAADIRAETVKKSLKLLRAEKLRLLAPLLGCGYDDLKQRHRQRLKRRIISVGSSILVFLCLLTAVGVYQWHNYREQKNAALFNNSLYLADLSVRQTSEGDALKGIETAIQALPGNGGAEERPYTAQAEAALYAALGDYRRTLKLTAHKAPITSICFNDNDTLAAVTSEDYTTSVWDLKTGRQKTVMRKGHTGAVVYADFSPEDDRLVTTSQDGTAVIWDVLTGNKLEKTVWSSGYAAFSADGKNIVRAEGSEDAKIFSAKNLEPFLKSFDRYDINTKANRIAAITESGKVELYALDSLEKISATADAAFYWHVKFSPDGRYVAASTDQEEVRVFSSEGFTQYFTAARSDSLVCFSFSHDSSRLAVGIGNEESREYSAVVSELEGQKPYMEAIPVNSGNHTALAAWFVEDGSIKAYAEGSTPDEEKKFLDIDRSGKKLLVGDFTGNMLVYDASENKLLAKLSQHSKAVSFARFSSDSRYIASGSFDNTVRIWDAATYKQLHVLKGYQNVPVSADFRYDGKFLVTGSSDGSTVIWDTDTGKQINKIKNESVVSCVRFSPDGNNLVLTVSDIEPEKCKIMLWNLEKNALIREIRGFKQGFFCAAFAGDGKRLAVTEYDNSTGVWDIDSGVKLFSIKAKDTVKDIQFDKSGDRLLLVYESKGAEVYKLYNGASRLVEYAKQLIEKR